MLLVMSTEHVILVGIGLGVLHLVKKVIIIIYYYLVEYSFKQRYYIKWTKLGYITSRVKTDRKLFYALSVWMHI